MNLGKILVYTLQPQINSGVFKLKAGGLMHIQVEIIYNMCSYKTK